MRFFFLILLLVVLGAAVYLLLKKRWRGLGWALGVFLLVVLVGIWAIFQSRSSTASIGILFLPFYGLFAGVMAWLFANLRLAERRGWRVFGWFCLAATLAVPVSLAYQGFNSIALNASRDAKYQASLLEIARNTAGLADTLAANPGREREVIDELINKHADDRNHLLPILESRFVSAETLDRLARSDDLGIALSAVRNPNCRAETLARIYRSHAYPKYFVQALAAHQNTPPDILLELYRNPATINGLDRSFASNPATPIAVIREITANTKESFVIQRLLENPVLDCGWLLPIEDALKRSERPEDSFSVNRLQQLRSTKCPISTSIR
jgi:hypothetical protein